jgi:hypothetical protein
MSAKVFEWLENLGPGQYAAEFDENDIGVNSTGHCLQILKAAKSIHIQKISIITVDFTQSKNKLLNE